MKIATWNVNSIRTRLPIIETWVRTTQPDIILLQEIKCINEAFPHEFIEDLGKPKFDNVGANGELDAYFSPSNSFSSSYSCIDNSIEKAENSIFSYLDGADNNSTVQPKTSLEANIKSQTNDAFEKLAAERKNDFAGIQRI